MQTSTDTNVMSYRPAEDAEKRTIMDLLDRWVRQRPGLDARAYIRDWQDANGRAAYRDDARTITRQPCPRARGNSWASVASGGERGRW